MLKRSGSADPEICRVPSQMPRGGAGFVSCCADRSSALQRQQQRSMMNLRMEVIGSVVMVLFCLESVYFVGIGFDKLLPALGTHVGRSHRIRGLQEVAVGDRQAVGRIELLQHQFGGNAQHPL